MLYGRPKKKRLKLGKRSDSPEDSGLRDITEYIIRVSIEQNLQLFLFISLKYFK